MGGLTTLVTEKTVTPDLLASLDAPVVMRGEYRGGHNLRKFTILSGYANRDAAERAGARLRASRPFADGKGGLRGYHDLRVDVEAVA